MRIYWFLNGNESVGSSRIHGINIHNKLLQLGYESTIVSSPPVRVTSLKLPFLKKILWYLKLRKGDKVVVLKLRGRDTLNFLVTLKGKVDVYYIDCDLPLKINIASIASAVICPSEPLKKLYLDSGVRNVHYIPDSPEVFIPYHGVKKRQIYTCVWFGFGSPEKWKAVSFLKNLLAREQRLKSWRLIAISDHPEADFPWDSTAFLRINQCDAVVIPSINEDWANVKSANRLLQGMGLSVPVLASSIPEYKKMIENRVNGFICDDEKDWIDALLLIEEDVDYRLEVINNAYQFSKQFHLDRIVNKWIDVLQLERDRR